MVHVLSNKTLKIFIVMYIVWWQYACNPICMGETNRLLKGSWSGLTWDSYDRRYDLKGENMSKVPGKFMVLSDIPATTFILICTKVKMAWYVGSTCSSIKWGAYITSK